MPIAVLLLLLAPVPVAMVGAGMDYHKEQQVNQLCVENFKTNEEIQQCKTILMRVKQ